jgi:alanine racemase
VSDARILVDLAAYARNLDTLRARVAPAELMAVVKADGYGHGLLPIARAAVANGVTWLGSLDIATGLELRRAGISQDVAIFAWLLGPWEDYREAIEARIDLGISTTEQLDQIADAGAAIPARLHLKIDTGLHRNGATEEEWPELVRRALELDRDGVAEFHAVWTHIAEASDEEDSAAIVRFDRAIAVAESLGASIRLRHLAASAAGLARSDARFDLVRIGAFSYGISPGGGITPGELDIVPVMTLAAPVLEVSDGLAELGIGYADGISSAAAGVLDVTIGGSRYPIVSVGFDRIVVDLEGAPIETGEDGILFGPGTHGEATLQEWGDALGTIGEEVVTRLSGRIRREYS